MSELHLLSPVQLQDHYVHQIQQTIHAYDAPHVVLGEALQNALDAVTEAGGTPHTIDLSIDFDRRRVSVTDDGVGFPNDPRLLFLGGSTKPGKSGLFGLVGVGMKVMLFSSSFFEVKARTENSSHKVQVADAARFSDSPPPSLTIPESFTEDLDPLPRRGTQITYSFPADATYDVFSSAFLTIGEACLPNGSADEFLKTIEEIVSRGGFPTRFAGLLTAFLRRYTYAGDVQNKLGGKPALSNTRIHVNCIATNPSATLDVFLGDLFDGQSHFTFDVEPSYLLVEDILRHAPTPKPTVFNDPLGRGGQNLQPTWSGFNLLVLSSPEEYESLLLNTRGQLAREAQQSIKEFREHLFPSINGIILVIGRIPDFLRFCPGGSRRVLSANGVVTTHDLDFTKGRNQQYVRCFDLVIDVDARLNYGKTQITDTRLINRVRRFANEAYRATIQSAAGLWVGTMVDDDDDDDQHDTFFGRSDLGLPDRTLYKEPRDENDVIALFFELAGAGMFPEYRFYGLSQRDKYDARATIVREGEDLARVSNPRDERDLRVIEFKRTAATIIPEFERHQKATEDVDLIIAWDEGVSQLPRYGFEDIKHSRAFDRTPKRIFPKVQRYLQDTRSGQQIQVLLLKPIVQTLRGNSFP